MIRISKEGVFFEFVEIDEEGNETKQSLDVLATSLGIVSYITFPVTIDEGVTVEDIMNVLALNPESTDYIFDSSLGGQSFTKFWDEMKQDSVQDQILSSMEIAHEIDPLTDTDMTLYSVARMRGVGKDRELFSVEFSPVSSYKKLEVKLNESYIVRKVNSAEKETIILSCTKSFSLFEVIHALLFEMSYYGEPEARKKVLDEVVESLGVEKIEAFKLKDRDDIEKLKKELQNLIENEDYEEAARIRDKIRRMLENEGEEHSDDSDV